MYKYSEMEKITHSKTHTIMNYFVGSEQIRMHKSYCRNHVLIDIAYTKMSNTVNNANAPDLQFHFDAVCRNFAMTAVFELRYFLCFLFGLSVDAYIVYAILQLSNLTISSDNRDEYRYK